jgi:hypothetical protein
MHPLTEMHRALQAFRVAQGQAKRGDNRARWLLRAFLGSQMAAVLADELGLQIGKAAVVRPRLAGHRGAARVVGEGGAWGCLIFIWALLTPARPRAARRA